MSSKGGHSRRRARTPPSLGVPEIKKEEIEYERDATGAVVSLGKGAYGEVLAARCRSMKVAVKVLKGVIDEKAVKGFKDEIGNLSRLYHPHICLFLGACTEPGNFMIVTERCEGGDCETLLYNHHITLSLTERMKMALEAALGVCWLHQSTPKFIHRDLKPSNLLLDADRHIKVCDFGLSQVLQGAHARDTSTAKGTPLSMAPEVLMFKPFSEKCDVYSFALVLWTFYTRTEPFQEYTKLEPFRQAICHDHVRPPLPDDMLPSLRSLISDCWQPDPDARPDFTEICARLRVVVVESACEDPLARALWLERFAVNDEFAPLWIDFIPPFLQAFRINDELIARLSRSSPAEARAAEDHVLSAAFLRLQCVRALFTGVVDANDLVSESDNESVNIERYGLVMDLFSPIAGASVLDEMCELVREPWFHGMMTSGEAAAVLRQAGSFLVRFSASQRGSLAISMVTQQRALQHLRVRHVPGQGFFFRDQTQHFERLQDLVVAIAPQVGLLNAAPSRFAVLVEKNPLVSEGYKEVLDPADDDVMEE